MASEEQLLSNQTHRNANLYAQALREQEEFLLFARSRNMAPAQALDTQRRVSHGIGGAGNIRRPSEVMFAKEDETGKERRRSFAMFAPKDKEGETGKERRRSFAMFAPKDKEGETGKGSRRSSVWLKPTPAPESSTTERRSSILSIFKSSGRW